MAAREDGARSTRGSEHVDSALSRRGFCRSVLLAALAAATGATAGGGCASAPIYRGALDRGRVAVPRERLLTAHAAAESEPGTLIVQAQDSGESILLMWDDAADIDSASYHAVSARCTHQACDVKPSRGFLTCPCHGSTFDREGRVIRGPAEAPLARLPVEVTANGLEIIVAER